MNLLGGALGLIFALGYPFIVYFSLGELSPRLLGTLLVGLYLARLYLTDGYRHAHQRQIALIAVCVLLLPAILNRGSLFLFVPVALNLLFFTVFLRSLIQPPSIIEQFAERYVGSLDDLQRRYCRQVTWSWVALCGFNSMVALMLALAGDLEWWTLFNGFVVYFLIGALFLGELFYRHWRFRHYVGLPTDPFFRRIFPPRDSDLQV